MSEAPASATPNKSRLVRCTALAKATRTTPATPMTSTDQPSVGGLTVTSTAKSLGRSTSSTSRDITPAHERIMTPTLCVGADSAVSPSHDRRPINANVAPAPATNVRPNLRFTFDQRWFNARHASGTNVKAKNSWKSAPRRLAPAPSATTAGVERNLPYIQADASNTTHPARSWRPPRYATISEVTGCTARTRAVGNATERRIPFAPSAR